jgi:hypothetical protein
MFNNEFDEMVLGKIQQNIGRLSINPS